MSFSIPRRSHLSNISLRWLLILPFFLQIIGIAGLIGYFAYRSGQNTAENWANHLLTEIAILGFSMTLLIAIGSVFLTTYGIIRPIKQLNQASKALAEGNWQETLPEQSAIAELESLLISFNQMSAKVRQLFEKMQVELQDSRETYQKVVQTQTDFVLRSQPDTTIIFANEALCNALGSSVEQVIGQKWIDFADSSDLERTLDQIATLTPENPSFIGENRDNRADGQMGQTQWINQGIFDETGQLIGIQSVGRDITVLKNVEAKLRESQHLIERITEATPSLLYIYDQIEQRNVYANRSVAEILGYSRAEIQAMGADLFAIICHPDDLAMVCAASQKIRTVDDHQIIETEYRVRDAQGEWRWLASRDLVFSRTEDGRVWQILGTAQDISDRKRIELEIWRVQTFLNSIIENIPNMVFVKDVENLRFVLVNKAGENLLGYTKEELLGKSDYNFFSPAEADFFITKDREVFAQNQVVDTPEEIIQTHHQGTRILHTKRIPIFDELGQPKYLLGISEDITEQIESENLLTQIARHIPGVIYQFKMRTDETFYFPYASAAIRDIYGVTPQEAKQDARIVLDVIHKDDQDRVYQSILDSAANLTPWDCEYRVCFADGRIIWVLGHATPRQEADGSTIWHGYIKNISDRKQAESLLIAAKIRAEEAELKLKKSQVNLERINQRLLKLIDTDGLTRIANRRCFNIRFKQEWKRNCRQQQPLSLLILDVDYFKKYNDFYGHPQGDKCLIKIAQTIKKTVGRSMDLVARYGGEEFAVILPNTDLEGAKVIADKIHQAIRQLKIPHKNSEISHQKITISLGIMSVIPTRDKSSTTLIDQADQALLLAKKQGRNQSVVFTQLMSLAE